MKSNKKISLACSVCRVKNYQTNKSNTIVDRVTLNKYCPKCKTKTLHKEEV